MNGVTYYWLQIIIICSFSLIISGQKLTKTWIQSNRLDDADLWKQNHVPCPGQKVVLPENEAVFVPNKMSLGPEIVLPKNGIVLFSR